MYDLGRQIAQRFRMWKEELNHHLYDECGAVSFSGFTTMNRLSPDDAEKEAFCPCPPGTAWGDMWEYGWFRADIALPPECEGRRAVLFSRVGGEQLIYVNGKGNKKNGYGSNFSYKLQPIYLIKKR